MRVALDVRTVEPATSLTTPETLSPLPMVGKSELGWGQLSPPTFASKNTRPGKSARMVSDSPRRMIKGFFFLERKITSNHSVSGVRTFCCETSRAPASFAPPAEPGGRWQGHPGRALETQGQGGLGKSSVSWSPGLQTTAGLSRNSVLQSGVRLHVCAWDSQRAGSAGAPQQTLWWPSLASQLAFHPLFPAHPTPTSPHTPSGSSEPALWWPINSKGFFLKWWTLANLHFKDINNGKLNSLVCL